MPVTLRVVARRAPVDVFRFDDYRAFLRAFYEHKKGQRGGISLRGFSRRVGLRSPNYLKLVIDGDRNLTTDLALRFAEACGLSGERADYFCTLVSFNQAKNARERDRHRRELERFRRYRETHKLAVAQDAYYGHWYIPAIRELCARADFRDDAAWIARTMTPSIKPAEARRAIAVLLKLGLVVRDDEGRLRQSEPLVETAPGPLGHRVVRYHREMMRLASEALERVPREEREIASLTLCVSAARLSELKAEVERIEDELLQRYGDDPEAERVVQLNLQLFPLSTSGE